MDGYGSYQGSYPGGAPVGPGGDYTPPPPRPPSQSSAPTPHQGKFKVSSLIDLQASDRIHFCKLNNSRECQAYSSNNNLSN